MGKGYKGTSMERFLRKIEKTTNCWEWLASKTHDNYGKFWFFKRIMKAHKVAYLLFKGDVPKGLCVLHSCDNPACVNPEHLWLGTQLENIQDREIKGRSNKGQTWKQKLNK